MTEQVQHVMCIARREDFKEVYHFSIDLALMEVYEQEVLTFSCYDTDVLDAIQAKAKEGLQNLPALEVVSVILAKPEKIRGKKSFKTKYYPVQLISYP
tara:strand:+ start:218 stop:511 length:294 start_codon:yes stop_codon:yes gene_type:complete